MKTLVRTVLVFTLATSIGAFAGSKKPDAPKAPNVENSATEAMVVVCPADQEINQAKTCIICQIQSEDSKEKAARQKLIKEQEKEWQKKVDYDR